VEFLGLATSEWFLLIEFPLRQQKLCVFYFPLCLIFVDTCCTHFIFRSQFQFSDAVLTGIPYYFRSLHIFRVYFSNIKRALLWQVSVSQVSRRQFHSSRKILQSFQLSKSRIPCSRPDGPVKRLDVLLCREDSNSSACIRPDLRATPSGRSSVFKKNPKFLYRHGSKKTACNCPDARATSSGSDLNEETHEARYGKAVAQFTIRMLYASIGRHLEKFELVAI
jgi:hypothetical protein